MAQPSIFISYRIADSRSQARLLFKTLDDLFPGQVFYDKNNLEPGMKWPAELGEKVRAAKVVLVLYADAIKWLGASMDAFGMAQRRIDDPQDWVRKEIETALSEHKNVIPVLLEGAKLPPKEALPDTLRPLLDCQQVTVREDFWENDLLPLVQAIQTELKGGGYKRTSQKDPLEDAIHQLGIDPDSDLDAVHLVNCDRQGPAKKFRKALNNRQGKADFQFYFICGCPNQMPASFSKRTIYDLIHDKLEGRHDAISYVFQEDTDRIKIENLPLGGDLETSQKRLKAYVARRFRFTDTQSFETFIETGVPKLPYDYVTAVFEVSEKEWDGDDGEIRQYLEWMIETFRCPSHKVPTFLFFIVVKSQNLSPEPAQQTARQKAILTEISELCQQHADQTTLLSEFPPIDEADFDNWIATLGVRNPNRSRVVTRALANTFEPGSEEDILYRTAQKFHMKDIEPVQRRIVDIALQ